MRSNNVIMGTLVLFLITGIDIWCEISIGENLSSV